jgi:hypothetical protein
MNNNIIVVEQGNVLVIDSRIIASELTIEHESFVKLIETHKAKIEAKFGVLRFEIGVPIKSGRGGRSGNFYWLTEVQSTAVLTLVSNTDRAVDLKFDLVEKFELAKKLLKYSSSRVISHIHDLDVLQLEFLGHCYFLRDENLPAAMKGYIPEAFWFLRKEQDLLEHLIDRHRELLEKRKLEIAAQNWMGVVHQAEAMRNGAFKKGIFWEPNLPELVEQQAVETIAQNKARIEIRQKEFQKKSQNKKYMFQVAEFQEQIDRSQIVIAGSKLQLIGGGK